MLSLQDLDSQISQQLQMLRPLIAQHKFQQQFEFVLGPSFDYDQISSLDFPGIYLFEIKSDEQIILADWITKFKEEWEDDLYKNMAVPNLKLKRMRAHTQQTDWVPLYIGKAECISKRLKEHLSFKLSRRTGALKLIERQNLHGQQFRVSTIRLDIVNYDIIVPLFEKEFRDIYNPIVGRQ